MATRELDPALLPTFLAVLDHGRISAAARAVHLSQPAVTARIRRLEETTGTPLFVRSVRGVSPTPAGERLGVRAREIQRLLDEASADLSGDSHQLGALSLVASTTIAAHVLPPVLARFRARYPDVAIEVEIGNTEAALDAVREGRRPLGLVEGHARASGIHLEPWVDDALLPVVGARSPWRVREIEDLADVPILWREPGSGTRAVLARGLREAGVRHRPRNLDLVLSSSEAIANAAASGLGVAFLSRWSLSMPLAAGRLRTLPALPLSIRRTFHWAMPTGAVGGTAGHFLAFARSSPPSPLA